MKKEKLILSFVAALVGILVAGIAFYFYQSTKEISIPDISTSEEEETSPTPTPTPEKKDEITISEPSNEAVVEKKTITIKGKTIKDGIILISSSSNSVLTAASTSGDFSTEFDLEDGVNVIHFTVFLPDGKEKSIIWTITYSTESF
ncbi:MAG: hypothetical protein HYT11_03885 [Candidatus Levybacteria bacterium]|nr:hypothetical protein [Candidatus Levybacteria bacterium]